LPEPTTPPIRYRSPDEDSARWLEFSYRPGDIVISTRSKSGTTWMQMICALLVFQRTDLPARLDALSPWLDWLGRPLAEVLAGLDAQSHRRFVKTHTPLDGIPLDPRVTYIVVARHPLDLAVSLYHQGDNLDRARISELTGQPPPSASVPPRPPLHEWLLGWIDLDTKPRDALDLLPGVMWHLSDAWRRRDDPNVVLVHYDDLLADLDGEMRRIATRLAIDAPDAAWPALVDAARFDRMQAGADTLAPDPAGVLKDRTRFFRRGSSGAGRELLTPAELAHYGERAASLAPPDLLAWLHPDP
jgi:aryl sulfotransferase